MKKAGIKYYLMFAIVAFALYLNQALTVYVAAFVTFCAFVLIFGRKPRPGIVVAFILIIIGMSLYSGSMLKSSSKNESKDIKVEQVVNGLALFADKPLLGQGLGYVYHDADSRHKDAVVLEMSYVTILASTGIVGFLFYAFIYLYYPVQFMMQKNKNIITVPIFLSCLSILIAGIGNPYIWSGCMGFLFIVFLAAIMDGKVSGNA
ncbi:MAG: O-antigen ligase family protein [Candidatus Omnitrophica bacterium]|nr:O-antigen ligase family protein [Candidatus Omnitrophota bacterium]